MMVHVIRLLLNIQRTVAFNSPDWCCTTTTNALEHVFCSTFLFVHKHDFPALPFTTAEPLQGTADLRHRQCAVVHPASMQQDTSHNSNNQNIDDKTNNNNNKDNNSYSNNDNDNDNDNNNNYGFQLMMS